MTKRRMLARLVAVAAFSWVGLSAQNVSVINTHSPRTRPPEGDSIRPFRIKVSKGALTDLRRRLAATRWPDQETVNDRSQGVQLGTLKELVTYWQTTYSWGRAKAKLNAFPQFITTIDGVEIHFIHVRSRHANS